MGRVALVRPWRTYERLSIHENLIQDCAQRTDLIAADPAVLEEVVADGVRTRRVRFQEIVYQMSRQDGFAAPRPSRNPQ
jgi:hypothetical protein